MLPDEVHRELWDRIAARLERGDALITTGDYVTALVSEYQAITGDDVTSDLRDLMRDAVSSFNREHPERYVALGLQNSVTRAFQNGCDSLAWDIIKIESAGARSVARFKSRDWVRGFLKEVHVPANLISEDACVRHAVDVATGRAAPLERRDISEPLESPVDAVLLTAAPDPEPETEPEPTAAEPPSEDTVEAIRDGTISESEAASRSQEQAEVRARIEQKEKARAGERVDSYVRQGYLTSEEGETARQLHDIDGRVERGDIGHEEADRLRNSLLDKEQRYALEKKVQGAVDHAVRFLEAFEAMQRISGSLDDGLRFLIFHKNILDDERGSVERSRAARELLEDREMLRLIVDIMDRKDQEIRMISVGLPPYSYVVKRNERIGNLIIEEEFVDDLRELSTEEMSDRLHSEDPQVRVRPAADIRCLIAIVNHLIKPTQWRKDVRLLRVQDTIEQFYHETEDIEGARKQAESFLQRRLRRMFRDLSADDKAEMEQRGADMIGAIEQKVIAERQAAQEAASADAPGGKPQADGGDDENLSEDEVKKGATIGRVEMRVAGQNRRVPRKIMIDPDDVDHFVLAQRNPETGELEPVLRRGAPRVIERGTDGMWRLVSG